MSHASTSDLVAQLKQGEKHYAEVLTEDSMSVELARYPNPEPKHPHKEDELYFIISGTGKAHVGSETYEVEEGDVIFVEQGVEHDFSDIDDEIVALVAFSGGEDSVLGHNS